MSNKNKISAWWAVWSLGAMADTINGSCSSAAIRPESIYYNELGEQREKPSKSVDDKQHVSINLPRRRGLLFLSRILGRLSPHCAAPNRLSDASAVSFREISPPIWADKEPGSLASVQKVAARLSQDHRLWLQDRRNERRHVSWTPWLYGLFGLDYGLLLYLFSLCVARIQ